MERTCYWLLSNRKWIWPERGRRREREREKEKERPAKGKGNEKLRRVERRNPLTGGKRRVTGCKWWRKFLLLLLLLSRVFLLKKKGLSLTLLLFGLWVARITECRVWPHGDCLQCCLQSAGHWPRGVREITWPCTDHSSEKRKEEREERGNSRPGWPEPRAFAENLKISS